MDWIYVSPHLDDAILSCGGILFEQIRMGDQAAIWTVFAGDPPKGALPPFAQTLHERWQLGSDAAANRRNEDIAACQQIGASFVHFNNPDCIYRRFPNTGLPVINAEEDLFPNEHPAEEDLIHLISAQIESALKDHFNFNLCLPMSIGGHVDHQITRLALEKTDFDLYFYADYPYLLKPETRKRQWLLPGWQQIQYKISNPGLEHWKRAIAQYQSQLSTFWSNRDEMEREIEQYAAQEFSHSLWLDQRTKDKEMAD